jgi:C1A family cysteine protease
MRSGILLLFFVCAFAVLSSAISSSVLQEEHHQRHKPDFSLERSDHQQLFEEWKAYYRKSYSSKEVEELRFYNFVGTIARARALNEKHNTPGLHGITKFADMSKDEFNAKYLMKKSDLEEMRRNAPSAFNNSNNLLTREEIAKLVNPHGRVIRSADGQPASPQLSPNRLYDWQHEGIITPVKNQESCGSCWAFSTTEQIESNWALKHGLPPPLSPQQIVDCDTQSSGCNGGWPQTAYNYVIKIGGLETNAEYPYIDKDGTCKDSGSKAVGISSYQLISKGNEAGMYQFVSETAPLSICLNDNNLQTYTGNNQILPASTCDPSHVNHCIQITGYLTDSNANLAAWNVRNSWGTDWGNDGYAYIEYGANACDLTDNPTTAIL